jgi:hypothetical protein
MLTVTVDRKAFAGPTEAYAACAPRIPDLMRAMLGPGAKWARVLEFQPLDDRGWPHWHLVIDLPRGMSLKKAQRRLWDVWRDSWSLARAGLDLQEVETVQGAARYLGKYFSKGTSVPPWVLDKERSPRMFGCSASAAMLAPARRRSSSRVRRILNREQRKQVSEAKRTTVRERLARSNSTVCVVARMEPNSKGIRRAFVLARRIRCPLRNALDLAVRDGIGAPSPVRGAFEVADFGHVHELAARLEQHGAHQVEPFVQWALSEVDARWHNRHQSDTT